MSVFIFYIQSFCCFKPQQKKTGGGPLPEPVDNTNDKIIPMTERELKPLGNFWDFDHGLHNNNAVIEIGKLAIHCYIYRLLLTL